MTTEPITNPAGADDDLCRRAMNARAGAVEALHLAESLPDGAPEQLGVLLRGMLTAQLAQVEMLTALADHLDAWDA